MTEKSSFRLEQEEQISKQEEVLLDSVATPITNIFILMRQLKDASLTLQDDNMRLRNQLESANKKCESLTKQVAQLRKKLRVKPKAASKGKKKKARS